MDLTKLVETVSEGEHRLSGNCLNLGGIDVLPILRYETLLWFRNGEAYKTLKPVIPKFTWKSKLKARFSHPKASVDLKNAEVLFYDPHFKTVKLNGLEYNHLLDPFVEHYSAAGKKVVKTSLVWRDSRPLKRFSRPIQFVFKDLWIAHFMAEVWNGLDIDDWVEQAVAEWRQATEVEINPAHFKNSLFRTLLSKYVFEKHFEDTDLERILFECYYKPEVLGLIAAASDMGIQTVDIQHGKQGTHHLMYTHWKTVPNGGFNVLPSNFWNWGEESVKNILENSSDRFGKVHRPIAVGYAWLDRCRDSTPFTLSKGEKQFLNRLESYKTIALVTLQPETVDDEGCIPGELLNAITDTRDDTFWLLRLHPTMKSLPNKLDYLGQVDHVDIKMGTALPLYTLLNVATHHITKFSSVAFEADYFGVPTYISGNIGKALFSNYIAEEKMHSNEQMDVRTFLGSKNLSIDSIQYFTSFEVPNS
ncbi:MAG: hypothetical protein Salg2KO_19330 [Salibacteraceae bacterium]